MVGIAVSSVACVLVFSDIRTCRAAYLDLLLTCVLWLSMSVLSGMLLGPVEIVLSLFGVCLCCALVIMCIRIKLREVMVGRFVGWFMNFPVLPNWVSIVLYMDNPISYSSFQVHLPGCFFFKMNSVSYLNIRYRMVCCLLCFFWIYLYPESNFFLAMTMASCLDHSHTISWVLACGTCGILPVFPLLWRWYGAEKICVMKSC